MIGALGRLAVAAVHHRPHAHNLGVDGGGDAVVHLAVHLGQRLACVRGSEVGGGQSRAEQCESGGRPVAKEASGCQLHQPVPRPACVCSSCATELDMYHPGCQAAPLTGSMLLNKTVSCELAPPMPAASVACLPPPLQPASSELRPSHICSPTGGTISPLATPHRRWRRRPAGRGWHWRPPCCAR